MFVRLIRSFLSSLAVIVAILFSIVEAKAQNKYEDSYNYLSGLEALANRDYSTSIDYLNKEIAAHKDNGHAYSFLAIAYLLQDDYDRSLSNLNNALKYLSKKDRYEVSFAYKVRANIYAEIGQLDNALADYTAAINNSPEEIEFLEARAEYYYDLKQYAESDADFNRILQLDPAHIHANMGMGRNCIARKEHQKAIDYFNYIVALYSDYSPALSFRAEAFFELKNYTNAAADVIAALAIDRDSKAFLLLTQYAEEAFTQLYTRLKAKVISERNDSYWSFCMGVLNESAKKYEPAIEEYKKAMVQVPNDLTASCIMDCYKKLGNWKAALEYIDKAIELAPEDIRYINDKATLYWLSGDLDSAIIEVNKCIETEPENHFYYHRRGWFKEYNNDLDGALKDYSTAIILEPTHSYSYMTRGRIFLARGKKEQAMEDFIMCTQLDTIPNNASSAEFALFYLGESEKAIAFMDKLLEDNPKENYYDAACLYSLMGDTDKALDYLQKSLEFGLNWINHIIRDHALDNIRGTEGYKSLISQYAGKPFTAIKEAEDSDEWVEKMVEVPFIRSSGITKIKCEINGLPLSFIFDEGASTVSISALEATFMYKNGYLSSKDIVGKAS